VPSRGFVAIWYSAYGMHQPNPSPFTRDTWAVMVAGVLRAWRAHHPNDRLVFLDLDRQFSVPESHHLADLEIENGETWYRDRVPREEWTRSYLDKARMLQRSPFDETCLFDLDMLFLANISNVFDLVGQVGLLGYPFYRRTRNRVNAGLWVVKDRSIWPYFWRAWNDWKAVRPHDDEAVLDLCIDRGNFSVTKLSANYGMDPFCWLMRDGMRRPGRGWCDVQEIHPPTEEYTWPGGIMSMLGSWTMGRNVVKAVHMSGARNKIVGSPLWDAYQKAVTCELVRRYGGCFPPAAA
jgi:hypothetical protein